MRRALRPLLLLALVLALVILGSSATLRLTANGLGCDPWPSCYGIAETANAAQGTALVKALRLTHRLTATLFGVLAVAIVMIGWRNWPGPFRRVGVFMLLVTALLAWVGLHTPSPLPLVTVVNVWGGLALIGAAAALLGCLAPKLGSSGPRPGQFGRLALGVLTALFVMQAAAGAMISARLAGSACTVGCQQIEWSADAPALLNPVRTGRVTVVSADANAGQTLHWVHRMLGAALLVGAATLIYIRRSASGRALLRVSQVLGVTFTLGVISTIWDEQLPPVVLHALLAGFVAAALGFAYAESVAVPAAAAKPPAPAGIDAS